MKEKLKNEVTKVNEKLEIYLSEINNYIKVSEKINIGIKSLENEKKDNNIIKTLSYVSKINKNKKELKKLLGTLMRSIKFSFKNENNKDDIKYEEYYFNWIPEPKNIKYNNLTTNSVNLSWSIDNLNLLNINKDEINYKIEIIKDKEEEIKKENEGYIKVYEGKNKNCFIDNLVKDTSYKINIYSFYNDKLIESIKQNIKIKTDKLDSVILLESKREDEFLKKIFEWSGCKKMDLLYRGSKDGSDSKSFHKKCDNKGPTITLYKNEKGYIFGGYASIDWTSEGNYHAASECFIFTLTNLYNTQPSKFSTTNSQQGFYHNTDYGPTFGEGCDICIGKDFNSNSTSDFPCRYQDTLGKGKSIFTGDFNNNESNLKVKEIEVFKIYK